LVSRTVRDLVVGSEFRFEDRGTHSLKGVEGDWQLFALARARVTEQRAAELIP
jgi:class 3 adenylate cyclase